MRKIICLLFVCAAFSAQAQKECGTMHYATMRQMHDPSYNARMESTENVVQQWIKQNYPSSDRMFPQVPEFIATGNVEIDNRNYALAKQKLYASKPSKSQSFNSSNDARMKEEKRKKNSFISITNN